MATLAARVTALAAAIRDKLNTMTPKLVPPGGGTGEVLRKASGADHSLEWGDVGGGWEQIAQITDPTGTTIDFVSIPQTYSDLLVVVREAGRGTAGAASLQFYIGNGTTFSGIARLISSAIDITTVVNGGLFFPGYTKDQGLASGGVAATGTAPNMANGQTPTVWDCPGGIKDLRFRWNAMTHRVGTYTLYGRK